MKQKQFPGLVVGVVKHGQVAVKKGYGVKSFVVRGNAPTQTPFFTWLALQGAKRSGHGWSKQGKLDLRSASNYLKGFPSSWQPITVKQFMAHQSGIPQLNWKRPTFKEMLKAAETMPLSFAPGTKQELE